MVSPRTSHTANIGIIGFGKMGILHAGVLNSLPGCRVAAICETEPLVRKLASKAIQGLKFYDAPLRMVTEENLDGVFVTTPILSHSSVVNELASSGKRFGLFVEKPLAGNFKDAQMLVDAASTFAQTAMIGFQKRFLPQFVRGKELLESGTVGNVNSFHGYSYLGSVFTTGKGWRFKKGGGALLDLGSHLIDILIWYFGMPNSIAAKKSSTYSVEVEDFAHVELGFKEGFSGSIDVSWSRDGYRLPETGLEITGSAGTLKVSDDVLELDTSRMPSGSRQAAKYILRRPEFVRGVDILLGDPEYCVEDVQFLSALANGSSITPNLEDGAKVNKVIELIHSGAVTE